jgi:flagellin
MSKSSVYNEAISNARHMDRAQHLLSRSLTRLSSGKKIVSGADDPQAIGLNEKLTAQQKRVQAASNNVQAGISLLQAADGLIGAMNRMTTRMSELSLLASDVMKNGGDIALYQTEFQKIQEQLRATIGGTTSEIGGTVPVTKPLGSFNNIPLFGPNSTGLALSTGDSPLDTITIPETNLRDGAMLELIRQDSSGAFTLTVSDTTAINKINAAIQDLADERGSLGAIGRRFELVATRLTKRGEELTATVSEISDVNVATESTRLAKYQFLAQGASTMLAQINQAPRAVLQLLRDSI